MPRKKTASAIHATPAEPGFPTASALIPIPGEIEIRGKCFALLARYKPGATSPERLIEDARLLADWVVEVPDLDTQRLRLEAVRLVGKVRIEGDRNSRWLREFAVAVYDYLVKQKEDAAPEPEAKAEDNSTEEPETPEAADLENPE